MAKPTRHFALILAALAVSLAALAALAFRGEQAGQGAAIGGSFALTAADGRTVTEADFAGRPYLVFFGYTHCPDICPATLAEISAALKALGPDKKIAALFVTIDPERDTPELLKAYLDAFDPRIVGLSGNAEQIRAAARSFRVYFKKQGGADGSYAVDHTGIVYLIDKRGRFAGAFNLDRPAQQAAGELAAYL